jgi:hypothetical protein
MQGNQWIHIQFAVCGISAQSSDELTNVVGPFCADLHTPYFLAWSSSLLSRSALHQHRGWASCKGLFDRSKMTVLSWC